MAGSLGLKAARIAIVIALFALWELLSRTGIVNPRLLPSASDTLVMLWELLQRAGIRNDLAVTASEVLTAFILAVPVGALIGFAIAENRYFAEVGKTTAVLRLQHSEIDLPADVHPGVRGRLRAEGRLRILLDHLHRHHVDNDGGGIRQGRASHRRPLLRRDAVANRVPGLSAEHAAGAAGSTADFA